MSPAQDVEALVGWQGQLIDDPVKHGGGVARRVIDAHVPRQRRERGRRLGGRRDRRLVRRERSSKRAVEVERVLADELLGALIGASRLCR
jgi:hypothetical protein